MLQEILGIVLLFVLTVLLALPLGRYIAKVYLGQPTWLDFMSPLEHFIYKVCRINPKKEMTWQEHLTALLTINFLWFFWMMFILMNQGWLPLNPDGNPSMSPDLAFNTAVSFLVNCNLQHYSGETGVTYFSQLAGLMFMQFVTAGTGMAAAAIVFKAMKPHPSPPLKGGSFYISLSLTGERFGVGLGNFYHYFLKSCTRILLPISLISAIILVFNGTPMNWEGKANIVTVQGDSVQVSRGPAAALIAIKQAGTNGGGYYGVNSAHPLENPNYLTNIVENILIILIPIAFVFALGFYLNRKKLAWMIFGVMTIGFLLLLSVSVYFEMQGNPALHKMGIRQTLGSMEGKEIRFGSAASAFWGITTTTTSNGSVNAMHDSMTPLSGAMQMIDMMINALYGGVGVGFLNFYVFIIISVFISGLMVGRTPEFLGKKIEAKEMKIATIIALLHTFLILAFTALSSYVFTQDPSIGWLNNPGFHGFSEMLYEYTSSSANNGSGFEGLGDNNPFWNITCGIVLILSRYLPIIGPVAIAGILANKKYIPESAGTLQTDTATFGFMVFAVIFIIAALSFFPALALGPLAEFFTLR
ncbi:potassium-transporting ATPase subunit KdpA [Runella slithyformis]|uniref:Potassium-transporting ATPase potassium-binding subunit n=1 Tax=Runella slithyformis (strain ATCC 29530 / DSM 19594 / LMG 11500 / NCIMB 11436 / LSU 4) TaxID=761193 RepID=A0A7U4E6K0_RUNSL|nr:potassium-transporting ATPase subunit KdpA [Runella slithyformis]AEI49419.1 Potassium-transporting ATPase A chain [Runella slithyformis DSM 19594]